MASTLSRRSFLQSAACGIGGLALASMLHDDIVRANPLAPRRSHRPAKAKAVIFLFMAGGPSHLETFDPKPLLNRLHGQPRPSEFGQANYQFIQPDARLLGTARQFRKHGQSGIDVSAISPTISPAVCRTARAWYSVLRAIRFARLPRASTRRHAA